MNKTIAYCIIITLSATLLIISVVRPELLSDSNSFLHGFVNHELLDGRDLRITLASTANIHLAFIRIEERHNAPGTLAKSRSNLKKATYWLIGLFITGAVGVVLKPISTNAATVEAIFNSGSLVILLWQVLILVSLTQLVFLIKPEFPTQPDATGQNAHVQEKSQMRSARKRKR
jgi:hypothetical protein